jgi:hypothetical protein
MEVGIFGVPGLDLVAAHRCFGSMNRLGREA